MVTITLADIEASEKICEAFNEKIEAGFEGAEMDGVDAIKLIGDFSHHARTQLPAMNKLVRGMLGALKFYANKDNYRCPISGGLNGSEVSNDFGDEARRLVERLEGVRP